MTAHEVLVQARNAIDRNGWIQEGIGNEVDGHCSLGACSYVCDGQESYVRALDALSDTLGTAGGVGIALWNDQPGRTKAHVLDLFDRAIARTAPAPAIPGLDAELEEWVRNWDAKCIV